GRARAGRVHQRATAQQSRGDEHDHDVHPRVDRHPGPDQFRKARGEEPFARGGGGGPGRAPPADDRAVGSPGPLRRGPESPVKGRGGDESSPKWSGAGGIRTRTVRHLKPASPASWTTAPSRQLYRACGASGPYGPRRGAKMPSRRGPYRKIGGSEPEFSLDTVDVAGGLHVVESLVDRAVGGDDDRGPDDALYASSVVLLLTEGAVGTQGVLVRVTQQGEGQPFLVPELGELVRGVGRDAEDGEPGGVEVTQVVTEVAGLCGAPRGHGRRVEIQHDPFAGVGEHLAEVHLVAVGICQGEVGCPVAGLQTNRFAHVVVSSGRGRSRPDRHDPHTNESEGVPGWGWGAD